MRKVMVPKEEENFIQTELFLVATEAFNMKK
jgi:hypothetical protein